MKAWNHVFIMGKKGFRLLLLVALSFTTFACITMRAKDATWKTVPETKLSYERAWSIVVNAVTQHFDLEISDGQSGYLRTGWKITKRDILGSPIKKARIHVRVEERKPFRVKVKAEKQEFEPFSEEWVVTGNDEKIESEIIGELSGRLRRG